MQGAAVFLAPDRLEAVLDRFGVPVIVVLGLIALFLLWLSLRTIGRRPESGLEAMVGLTGIVRRNNVFRGRVLVEVRGELWWARCSQRIEPGSEVRVSGVRDMMLTVEPMDAQR